MTFDGSSETEAGLRPRGPEGPAPRAAPTAVVGEPVAEASPSGAERLAVEGADRLSTVELLSIVLAEPTPALGVSESALGPAGASERSSIVSAVDVLQRFGSLRRASAAAPAELASTAGVSPAAAARLAAALALGRRAGAERLRRGAPFRSSLEIFERYQHAFRDAKKERFLTVMLDGKNRMLREDVVSEGSLTQSLVHPREVFAPAIRESAAALVFVHNHPSGDPEPSPDDIDVTNRLCSVGEIVGIRVLEHVVIGDGCFVSFLDRGWISR